MYTEKDYAVFSKISKRKPTVKFKKAHPDVMLPEYKHATDAGMDIQAYIPKYVSNNTLDAADSLHAVDDHTWLNPGERYICDTGLIPDIPPGFEIQVRPRSGLAAKYGITVLNTPGTIDEGYKDTIKVILINHGLEAVVIKSGDRIAQLVVTPYVQAIIEEVAEVNKDNDRGGGCGSTGI
jgi:dUTP pyrophosphatase